MTSPARSESCDDNGLVGEIEYKTLPYLPGQFGRVLWYDLCDRNHLHYIGSDPLTARVASHMAERIASGQLRFEP